MRVQRLDGQELDVEVVRGLSKGIVEALSGVGVNMGDEILALIRSVYMWKYLRAFGTVYGMDLHRLKYKNINAISSVLLVVLRVVMPYVHGKMKDRMAMEEWSSLSRYHVKRRIASVVEGLEGVFDAGRLLNWLSFIGGGRYADLSERVLGLQVAGSGRLTSINLEFTQRQLVWSVLTVRILVSQLRRGADE